MTIPEPIKVTLAITEVFETLGIRYFIGGSMATAAHGVARSTLDVDLIADISESDIDAFDEALGEGFFVDIQMIRNAIRRKASFNIIHKETFFKIDVFPTKGRPFDQSQFKRRTSYPLTGETDQAAYIATPEDNILAKLEWYRLGGEVSDRQWLDILNVVRIQGDRLDRVYLEKWATELQVNDLLITVFAQTS